MIEIVKYGEFKPTGKQKKKHQIILLNTLRNIDDYLKSLKYRYNGKFTRIPNYIVNRNGDVMQLLSNVSHSNFFTEPNINRNSIIICIENLGWLEKEPLKDYYINWIGDIYKGVPYERKWRDYFFWQPYTTQQIDSLSLLCSKIIKEMSIKRQVVGHNTKINGIEKYEGIVTRSNFEINYTDVSPAFDFDGFIKKIENE